MLGYFDLEPQLVLNELARRRVYPDWLKKPAVNIKAFCVYSRKTSSHL